MEITATKTTEVSADLKTLAEDAQKYAEASKAVRTREAYASDWAGFEQFCRDHDLQPLPASVETVALYVTWAAKQHKVSTIRRRLAAISEAHKLNGGTTPTRDARIGELLKGITKTQAAEAKAEGRRSIDRQAKALDAYHVVAMISHIRGDDMAAIRDRALIALGFAGFMRRIELVGLTTDSLEWVEPGPEVVLHLATSKTDQEGKGSSVRIECGNAVCPPTLLREWLDAAEITEGPLFRPVTKGGTIRDRGLTGHSVGLILKKRAEAAGIDPELVSGHSLRRGAATTAYRQGADALAIARRGRWADGSHTLNRYIESTNTDTIDLGL